LELGELPVDFTSNQNISPGQNVGAVTDSRLRNVELFRWGLIPSWAKDPSIGYKMFNARSETIAEKPSFRTAFAKRRCLILADGFYEWKLVGNKKVPFLFKLKDQKPFTFAGIWETWTDILGNKIPTCSIITTSPNSLMAEYHDRMPVIFDTTERWNWLEDRPQDELIKMMTPLESEKMAIPVQIEPQFLYQSKR
jgi:putative SOS response-associated peptidase YedK